MLAWLGQFVSIVASLVIGVLVGIVFGDIIKGLFQKKV